MLTKLISAILIFWLLLLKLPIPVVLPGYKIKNKTFEQIYMYRYYWYAKVIGMSW